MRAINNIHIDLSGQNPNDKCYGCGDMWIV